MRRTIVALAAVLVGCGAPARLTEGEHEQSRQTLQSYAAAMVERDGEGVCATLTRAMRARHRGTACPERIPRHARLLEFGAPAEVTVTRELRDDGTARAVVMYRSGAGTSGGEVALKKEGGRWLLDRDLSCITPACEP